jgi:hypothetical protein
VKTEDLHRSPRTCAPSFAAVTSVACIALAALLATPREASAEDAGSAAALFDRGLAAMKAGDYDKACPALAESNRLESLPGTLFTLAECEAFAGKLSQALAHYGDYLERYAHLPPAQQVIQKRRSDRAREQRDALARKVPKLTLVLPASAPGATVVQRDGTTLGAASLGVPLPVDPGAHRVTTQVPGGREHVQSVALVEGEAKTLNLEIEAPEPSAAPKEPPHVAPSGDAAPLRAAGIVVTAVGLAGIVVGSVEGGIAIHQKSVVSAHCPGYACDATGLSAVSAMSRAGLISSVAFGIGAAGVGAGIVTLVLAPRRAVSAPSATAARSSAATISVEVCGPGLSARGAF